MKTIENPSTSKEGGTGSNCLQVELGSGWGPHATARILASDYTSFRCSLNEPRKASTAEFLLFLQVDFVVFFIILHRLFFVFSFVTGCVFQVVQVVFGVVLMESVSDWYSCGIFR